MKRTENMSYFNYHAAAKKMIKDGKLISWYYTERHNAVSPALVLMFDDVKHPVMPIRKERWAEYEELINKKGHNACK